MGALRGFGLDRVVLGWGWGFLTMGGCPRGGTLGGGLGGVLGGLGGVLLCGLFDFSMTFLRHHSIGMLKGTREASKYLIK